MQNNAEQWKFNFFLSRGHSNGKFFGLKQFFLLLVYIFSCGYDSKFTVRL